MKPLTPQELSIGNLLNYDTGESIGLTVIDWQDLMLLETTPDYFNKRHTPVPLAPEILEGFGFESFGNYGIMKLVVPSGDDNDYEIHYVDKGIQLYSEDGDQCMFLGEIHAHTLQNFVQSISGVELVYKQNKTE